MLCYHQNTKSGIVTFEPIEFLRELVVGVAAPSDLADFSGNPSFEGGDVEQVCSNLETILSYL